MQSPAKIPLVAIACGGTGGHLFPGLAVGEELRALGCDVMLLVSPKDVDQQAVRNLTDMQVVTLPAVGLVRGNMPGFLKGFRNSFREARRAFGARPPHAVLAMGGFTSAPPVLAGRKTKAATFLHESNTIPGRANRFLAWFVDQAFVGFPSSVERLHTRDVLLTGTPVRPQFKRTSAEAARTALGLQPHRDTLLVMGGSQGASAINQLAVRCLADLRRELPEAQFLHLTGAKDFEKVAAAYREAQVPAVVRPFLTEMELALSAATVAVSRSGASSLAEFAAMRLPSILIPFPAATDDHQFHNARALVETGAARMLGEQRATPENLTQMIVELMVNPTERRRLSSALAEWHYPNAARDIAEAILKKNLNWVPRLPQKTEAEADWSDDEAPANLKVEIPNLR
ncbi:MAG TPA: undecaprenyldiphospho-muramoylpentapeptide beta-N-acetylglucosaminyltransferase [Methylomirabilota bacterium]|nr:undecaprenyldiphospho-muramoylpentapeptide beta-N-acetylglucosaminyltransferase [Methylomirabilota bacterium]